MIKHFWKFISFPPNLNVKAASFAPYLLRCPVGDCSMLLPWSRMPCTTLEGLWTTTYAAGRCTDSRWASNHGCYLAVQHFGHWLFSDTWNFWQMNFAVAVFLLPKVYPSRGLWKAVWEPSVLWCGIHFGRGESLWICIKYKIKERPPTFNVSIYCVFPTLSSTLYSGRRESWATLPLWLQDVSGCERKYCRRGIGSDRSEPRNTNLFCEVFGKNNFKHLEVWTIKTFF